MAGHLRKRLEAQLASPSFFPEADEALRQRVAQFKIPTGPKEQTAKTPRARSPRQARPPKTPRDPNAPAAPRGPRLPILNRPQPCAGCPSDAQGCKIPPTIVETARCKVVGLAPGEVEEQERKFFVGPSGILLRSALRDAGLDPERDVNYLNLGRCRPPDDNFDTKHWKESEAHCLSWLAQDFARAPGPTLVLGGRALHQLLMLKDAYISAWRGLWGKVALLPPYPLGLVSFHPSHILRAHPERRPRLEHLFRQDVATFARGVLGTLAPPPCDVQYYRSIDEARLFLQDLAERDEPWAFDIETYDHAMSPSRHDVATDPLHPDFRVRGVAIATSAEGGYWIEFGDESPETFATSNALLRPAFNSPAPKRAFYGTFDIDGLVSRGWVRHVRAREDDPWLALIALSDGRRTGHGFLRLERAVVDVLGWDQYWTGINKSMMRDLPVEQVADGAVRDACATYALSDRLREYLMAAQYLGDD
jgi:uracil-DNA glycosylase family 4